jgi:hypothetical protein
VSRWLQTEPPAGYFRLGAQSAPPTDALFPLADFTTLNMEAVSRWIPTAAVRVRVRVSPCGICGEQSGTGVCFLRVFRVSLPIYIPPIAPESSS